MLQSILKLKGVKSLSKNEKMQVKAGFRNGICPSEGEQCNSFNGYLLDCLSPIQPLVCVGGVWTEPQW